MHVCFACFASARAQICVQNMLPGEILSSCCACRHLANARRVRKQLSCGLWCRCRAPLQRLSAASEAVRVALPQILTEPFAARSFTRTRCRSSPAWPCTPFEDYFRLFAERCFSLVATDAGGCVPRKHPSGKPTLDCHCCSENTK